MSTTAAVQHPPTDVTVAQRKRSDDLRLMHALEDARAGLPLGVADLLKALAPEDIDGIKSGGIPPETVRAFAQVVAATGPWESGRPMIVGSGARP